MRMFAIHDKKLDAYMQPFFSQSQGAAIRAFGDLSKDKTHPIGQHPEDYTLWYLGVFDDQTGLYGQADDRPTQIATALQFIE